MLGVFNFLEDAGSMLALRWVQSCCLEDAGFKLALQELQILFRVIALFQIISGVGEARGELDMFSQRLVHKITQPVTNAMYL